MELQPRPRVPSPPSARHKPSLQPLDCLLLDGLLDWIVLRPCCSLDLGHLPAMHHTLAVSVVLALIAAVCCPRLPQRCPVSAENLSSCRCTVLSCRCTVLSCRYVLSCRLLVPVWFLKSAVSQVSPGTALLCSADRSPPQVVTAAVCGRLRLLTGQGARPDGGNGGLSVIIPPPPPVLLVPGFVNRRPPNITEHRALTAFVWSVLGKGYPW